MSSCTRPAGAAARSTRSPLTRCPPAQRLECSRVLGHAGVDLGFVHEHVQAVPVWRDRDEDLAADPERRHVEMRFLGYPGQGQREPAGTLKVTHAVRLAVALMSSWDGYGAARDRSRDCVR
jgi:hypothetical protein